MEAGMSDDVHVGIEIDSEIRDRAEKALGHAGLTLPEYLRLAVTQVADDGALPQGVDLEYDAWVRQMVQEALDDPSPLLSSEEVERHMAEVRADVARKLAAGNQ
jgi:DNA-damage-inducible protein J